MTNTVMPVGGLIRPIVHITVTNMPNQMPSKPMLLTRGSVTGTVMGMVLTSSRNVPSRTQSAITAMATQNGGSPMIPTHLVNSLGNCVSTMTREKMTAPTTM